VDVFPDCLEYKSVMIGNQELAKVIASICGNPSTCISDIDVVDGFEENYNPEIRSNIMTGFAVQEGNFADHTINNSSDVPINNAHFEPSNDRITSKIVPISNERDNSLSSPHYDLSTLCSIMRAGGVTDTSGYVPLLSGFERNFNVNNAFSNINLDEICDAFNKESYLTDREIMAISKGFKEGFKSLGLPSPKLERMEKNRRYYRQYLLSPWSDYNNE